MYRHIIEFCLVCAYYYLDLLGQNMHVNFFVFIIERYFHITLLAHNSLNVICTYCICDSSNSNSTISLAECAYGKPTCPHLGDFQ